MKIIGHGRCALAAAVLLWALGASGLPAATAATVLPAGPDLERSGWRLLTVPGKPASRFGGDGKGTIAVTASGSVAFLYYPLPDARPPVRYLSWRWRVDRAPPPAALDQAGADDRPLAVHVAFVAEHDGLWRRLRRGAAELIGVPLPGKVLTYVWGGEGDRGTRLANPHYPEAGMLIVLRPGSAPTAEWHEERIDLVADFTSVFGHPPPPLLYVAISADTDDRGGESLGWVADIVLSGP